MKIVDVLKIIFFEKIQTEHETFTIKNHFKIISSFVKLSLGKQIVSIINLSGDGCTCNLNSLQQKITVEIQ